MSGHLEVVRELLAAGAAVEAAMENGATPLHIAAQNGRVDAMEALLQAGANKDAAKEVRPGGGGGGVSVGVVPVVVWQQGPSDPRPMD
ncbi:hypothetical protein GPECTOR_66g245 [Gonium pectorale]|uniref:Uncharacterized protein n=1 Tax=Gonium pectorale TaxID=33097 RepID=A0A150G3T7_GONPE|nr:hypothetical protein GPECTOR_66g245 [Gonium pectorale]|eukprot:KXZ44517.1 hypothetical protein GPECTOR_66g245 [Gonium pectorale]